MTSGPVDMVGGQGMQTVVVLDFVVFLFACAISSDSRKYRELT